MTGTSSASLTNDKAFYSLLQDCLTSKEATPIVDFPKDHPIFRQMCVKIDLNIVATKFKVNTHQWEDIEAQYGE
jgi:DNA-directed RNA polymerase subunit L